MKSTILLSYCNKTDSKILQVRILLQQLHHYYSWSSFVFQIWRQLGAGTEIKMPEQVTMWRKTDFSYTLLFWQGAERKKIAENIRRSPLSFFIFLFLSAPIHICRSSNGGWVGLTPIRLHINSSLLYCPCLSLFGCLKPCGIQGKATAHTSSLGHRAGKWMTLTLFLPLFFFFLGTHPHHRRSSLFTSAFLWQAPVRVRHTHTQYLEGFCPRPGHIDFPEFEQEHKVY